MTQKLTTESDAQDDGRDAIAARVVTSSEDRGPKDPRAIRHESAAGSYQVAQSRSSSMDRESAIELLRTTVDSFQARQAGTAAAGVSARMREVNPLFTPASVGFRSFRELLEAAAGRGVVRLERPQGSSDIRVYLADSQVAESTQKSAGKEWMRRDLWKALRGRGEDPHAFNRVTKATRRLPSGTDLHADEVLVPKLSTEALEQWMTHFVERMDESLERVELLAALAADDSVEQFYGVVGDLAKASRKWSSNYRKRLTALADEWADTNGIPRSDLRSPSRAPEGSEHLAIPDEKVAQLAPPTLELAASDTALKAQILRALEQMSLAELLRLPIPAEYLLRR